MQNQIFFSSKKEKFKIRNEIIDNINKATIEIKVAVAWLNDEDILLALTKKKEAGLDVKIAISDSKDNFNNTNKFKKFLNSGGKLFISTEVFLHHKFCLIDNKNIINGSYNWSYHAQTSEENIMVITIDNTCDEDIRFLKNFTAKHDFLCNKCSVPVLDIHTLNSFKDNSKNIAQVLSKMDEAEINLRQEFENEVRDSFDKAIELKITVSPVVFDNLMANGGGVESVKRLLHDEISSGDMKSGFRKLEEHIPHRVDLSFEYLVARPKYAFLFSDDEVKFCRNLMQKYGLN